MRSTNDNKMVNGNGNTLHANHDIWHFNIDPPRTSNNPFQPLNKFQKIDVTHHYQDKNSRINAPCSLSRWVGCNFLPTCTLDRQFSLQYQVRHAHTRHYLLFSRTRQGFTYTLTRACWIKRNDSTYLILFMIVAQSLSGLTFFISLQGYRAVSHLSQNCSFRPAVAT